MNLNHILLPAILIALLLLAACAPAPAPTPAPPTSAPAPTQAPPSPTAVPPTSEPTVEATPTIAPTPTKQLEIYREFEAKPLVPESYSQTVMGIVAGGLFINTAEEWQQTAADNWGVVEDVSSHTPIIVAPAVTQHITEQFAGNFGASPWAEIFDQTRGSTLDGKFRVSNRTPAIATFDGDGNPIIVVSLAESNPIGEKIVTVILSKKESGNQISLGCVLNELETQQIW